ncbi:MAG: hypothetical protein KDI44_04175 [Thiothrix sp.]|nr:hypothetical protein [Thiothrix sp.]HPQ94264.1 hypothetical protein [Thiolinea sp.]
MSLVRDVFALLGLIIVFSCGFAYFKAHQLMEQLADLRQEIASLNPRTPGAIQLYQQKLHLLQQDSMLLQNLKIDRIAAQLGSLSADLEVLQRRIEAIEQQKDSPDPG